VSHIRLQETIVSHRERERDLPGQKQETGLSICTFHSLFWWNSWTDQNSLKDPQGSPDSDFKVKMDQTMA